MSQYDYGTIDPNAKTGTELANDLNLWRDAVHSSHSGVARPSYVKPNQVWVDTSASPVVSMYLFDGTADILIHKWDSNTHQIIVDAGAYVLKAGDTMTGDLLMNPPAANGRTYYYSSGIVQGSIQGVNGIGLCGVNSAGNIAWFIKANTLTTAFNGISVGGPADSYAVDGLVSEYVSPDSWLRACRAAGNYSSMKFSTAGANSAGAQALRMTIDSEGQIGMAAPPEGGVALNVGGTIRAGIGADFGTNLNLWVDGSGLGHFTAAFCVFDTGPNAARTTKLVIDFEGDTYPNFDNAQTLGAAANRWSVVYAGTGTINTSDARDKTAIAPLTQNELNAAKQLAREIGTYKFLTGVRTHVGLTVQRAIEIMQSNSLDPFAYGFICFDEWEATETPVPQSAGSSYGFRHDELLMFIARGFAARLDAFDAYVAAHP